MWDDLDRHLEKCESRLKEARRLLREQQRGSGETLPDGMLETVARALVSIQDADRAALALSQALRDEADRKRRERGPWAHDPATISDLFQALGVSEPILKPFPRPDGGADEPPAEGDRPESGPPDDDGGPIGNAPVPAVPKGPQPLVGAGAARTVEEALAPPRDP